jgi:hypothetical protein
LARLTARPLDTTKAALAATRAADLADRCEAAGMLVAASVLRMMALELEALIVAQRPPRLPTWLRSPPQPEVTAPLSRLAVRRHDPGWEPGTLTAHARICAGGGEQSPSLPRRAFFNWL